MIDLDVYTSSNNIHFNGSENNKCDVSVVNSRNILTHAIKRCFDGESVV